MANEHDQSQENWDKLLQSCEPVQKFLEFENHSNQSDTESGCLDNTHVSTEAFGDLEKNDKGNELVGSSLDQYFVPLSLIERWGSAMGILNFFCLSSLTSLIYYVLY